jgi:predicted ATPase
VKGKVLLSQPQPNRDQAQVEFMQSLELSRRESARAWELRTAMDLAELLAGQQRRNDAKQLLQSAVEGFAEGSDTADIRAASRLLGTL